MGACMRDGLGIRGKLTIVKTDRVSGKTVEKRETKNVITVEGSHFILRCLYDPVLSPTFCFKVNELYLFSGYDNYIKRILNPTGSIYDSGDSYYIVLTWNDASTDQYTIDVVGLSNRNYPPPAVINPNAITVHLARLSPSLEKQSSDTVTYKWTIKLPYGVV